MNPKSYCITHGISTKDFIAKAQHVAPKYSKVAHCMASDPAYGVALRSDVARRIAAKPETRKLPCRLYLRTTPAILARLTGAKEKLCFSANQDLLHFILARFLTEMEKGGFDKPREFEVNR